MIRWIQNISISYQRFCRQGQRSTEKYQAERSLWSLSYSEAYLCFMSVSLTDIFIFLAQISCIVWTRSNFLGSFTKSVPDHGRCQQSLKKHIIARALQLCLKKLTSSGQKYCQNIAIIYQSTESFYFVEGMPIFQKRQDSSFCATKSRL